jgi:trimeric autotransporter adhesin
MRSAGLFAAATAVVFSAAFAAAQCPPPSWTGANVFAGVGSNTGGTTVHASTVWDPDGAGPASPVLVVGGSFLYAGGVAASGIATWDGTNWAPLGTGIAGIVRALCEFNGELIAGGTFPTAGGAPAANVARWNGSSWQPLGPGTSDTVRALVVHNGQLIAGGPFTQAGGNPANHVAQWNGISWSPLAGGVGNVATESVSALTSFGGDLVAGGDFVAVGPTTVNGIARWDGISWQPLGAGGGIGVPVNAFTVYNAELVGVSNTSVQRWTGASWIAFSPGLANGRAATVWNGELIVGKLWIGGNAPVVKWTGSSWQTFGGGITGPAVTAVGNALTVFSGELVAGGIMNGAGGIPVSAIARWNGATWQALGTGMNGKVVALTVHGGDLVAGGAFTWAPGVASASHVVRWNGSSWTSLGPGIAAAWPITSVNAFTTWNGNLTAGGYFNSTSSVAWWTGASWQSVLPGIFTGGSSTAVQALSEYGGQLYAGGAFTAGFGNPASYLMRFTGAAWTPVGSGLNGPVLALAVYNGELYAGGPFSLAGGVAAQGVARWNGTSWQPVGTGVQGGHVRALTVSNGTLLAGGTFASAGGVTATGIAQWDGASWQALLDVGNTGVHSIAVLNGDVYASASTWALPSGFTQGVARFDGTAWHPLGSGMTGVFPGPALATHGGQLFAGGEFLVMGGIVSPYLSRWGAPNPTLALTQPGGAGAGVVITNTGLVPGREYYNVFSDSLCPGPPGTGPYLGLCAPDPSFLLLQFSLPVGSVPIHFVAGASVVSSGGYQLPAGLSLDGVCFDWTGGSLGCWSQVARITVQ